MKYPNTLLVVLSLSLCFRMEAQNIENTVEKKEEEQSSTLGTWVLSTGAAVFVAAGLSWLLGQANGDEGNTQAPHHKDPKRGSNLPSGPKPFHPSTPIFSPEGVLMRSNLDNLLSSHVAKKNGEQKKISYCKSCSQQATKTCGVCGTPYCSSNCQKQDWSQHRKQCKRQPAGHLIKQANMQEMVITRSTEDRPIVATDGCGPCIALGGYDPTNGVAFVIHFSGSDEVISSADRIIAIFRRYLIAEQVQPMRIYIHGGIWNNEFVNVIGNEPEKMRAAIKAFLLKLPFKIEIVSEQATQNMADIFNVGYVPQSLLIDSRNGSVQNYNRHLNTECTKKPTMPKGDDIQIL